MAKKGKANILGYLYLVGLALVVIGFFCPMFKAGPLEPNGWDFLNFENFGLKKIHGQEIKSVEQAGDLMSDYLEAQGTMEELGNIISKALIKSLGMKQSEGK